MPGFYGYAGIHVSMLRLLLLLLSVCRYSVLKLSVLPVQSTYSTSVSVLTDKKGWVDHLFIMSACFCREFQEYRVLRENMVCVVAKVAR